MVPPEEGGEEEDEEEESLPEAEGPLLEVPRGELWAPLEHRRAP